MKKSSGRRTRTYKLCDECNNYLVEGQRDWRNMWPLFFYHLLFGLYDSKFHGTITYHIACGGDNVWKLIPSTMRSWWYDEISLMHSYQGCTLDIPLPIFEDKTLHFSQFNKDYNSGNLAKVVDAMNNHDVIDSNVLCPWSCSTSCRGAGRISFDLMIQRLLPEVKLLLHSSESESKYCMVQSCSDRFF